MNPPFAEILFNLPLDRPFHYRIPPPLRDRVVPGMRVEAPFGRAVRVGYCVGLSATTDIPESRIRDLLRAVDDIPLLSPGIVSLARWMAETTACGWGEALEAALPAGVRRGAERRKEGRLRLAIPPERVEEAVAALGKRGEGRARVLRLLAAAPAGAWAPADLARKTQVGAGVLKAMTAQGLLVLETVDRPPDLMDDVPEAAEGPPPENLTAPQAAAVAAVVAALVARRTAAFLLHGVTGSGKTEVYLRGIAEAVRLGRQAIVLVPEISLTPQTVRRFRGRFPRTAVLHSHLTESDRADQWRRIARGEADVVVGARSAIFAPVPALGLVVVDEEHEPSYKQQSAPRYHLRDAALARARIENAVCILGTATPSLEAWHAAQEASLTLLTLPDRVEARPLPPVILVDMAEERRIQHRFPLLSRFLVKETGEAVARGEQVILFLNRRGFFTTVSCRKCGWRQVCPRCDVVLTYHRARDRSLCHHCGSEAAAVGACPDCGFAGLRQFGAGTERVEEEIREAFPDAVIDRMDSDEMTGRESYREALGNLWSGKTQILVGTQMIAKGLDVPNVTLVGVVSADTAFFLPDFRAAERTFQLLIQVAGRAGRGPKGGKVIVQSFHPDHYAVKCAAVYDYDGFAREELEARQSLGWPPYTRLVRILMQGSNLESVTKSVESAAAALRAALPDVIRPEISTAEPETRNQKPETVLLGPVPAPIARLKGKHRMQLLLKAADLGRVLPPLKKLKAPHGIQMMIDVDPVSFQ